MLYGEQAYTRMRPLALSEMEPVDDFLERASVNLEKITSFIEKYPETTFYVFAPPYSILYWDYANRQGRTDAYMAVTEYAIEQLLQYSNVKLFYFQNVEQIVTNLDNYKDFSHYSAEISYDIVEYMKNEDYLLTKENYQFELDKMKTLIKTFDYEQFFK